MPCFTSFISKNLQFLIYSFFFLLKKYFLCDTKEKKTQIKNWVTVLISSQKDNKRTILASNDHFLQRNWGEFQEKHLFSPAELSKSLLKPFWLQKGPFDWWKVITFEVTMLCAAGDVQCRTRELPKGPCSPKRLCALVFLFWNDSFVKCSVLIGFHFWGALPTSLNVTGESCLRADVSYFLCCPFSVCNKGNRRRLHAGIGESSSKFKLVVNVYGCFV